MPKSIGDLTDNVGYQKSSKTEQLEQKCDGSVPSDRCKEGESCSVDVDERRSCGRAAAADQGVLRQGS